MDSDLSGGLNARETAGEAEARLASPRTTSGTFMAAMNAGAADKRRADAEAAAKAQRRADLVTLVSAVMPSVVPALLDNHLERQSKRLGRPSDGSYVNARQVFAVPDVAKEAAAISLEISEAALALIEERTK